MKKKILLIELSAFLVLATVGITASALCAENWSRAGSSAVGKSNTSSIGKSVADVVTQSAVVGQIEPVDNVLLKTIELPIKFTTEAIIVENSTDLFPDNETITPNQITLNYPLSIMPDQSYIGIWYMDDYRTDAILIYEITSDSIKFNTGIFRLFGFTAIAVECEGEFLFGYDNSLYGGLKGRLKFEENNVTVIYDSFGYFDDYNIGTNVYQFTTKDNHSNDIVNQFKAIHPNMTK